MEGISKNWRENGFRLSENQLPTSKNTLPLAGIFLKKWIPPNFNTAFHKKQESSRIHAQQE